jgi:peptidoglycan/LPS O-acetylase OafA/YrhL
MIPSKIYFPHLNGIRFIAAFLVIIHHIEQFKAILHLDSLWGKTTLWGRFTQIIGPQGVVLFFVLSGFLITYLLLAEEKVSTSIHVKKFYIRRILRIWPLYLLLVFLSLLVLPHFNILALPGYSLESIQSDLLLKIALYIFFFANLVLVFWGVIPYASQTWSIGTEEQFYLVWPVIIKKIKNNRLILMVIIVLGYNAIRIFLATHYSDFLNPTFKSILSAFWGGFTIDCMAIGGFFAVLLYNKERFLKLFLNNWVFYFSIVLAMSFLIKGIHIPYIHSIVYSVLYAIIILNFAANKQQRINLENPILNYLGNISYGLYMLHPIGIVLAIKLAMYLNYTNNWFIYPLTILITIALAAISYRWYESYFLSFKSRFAIVKSGSEE